jgi:hypothetical protein
MWRLAGRRTAGIARPRGAVVRRALAVTTTTPPAAEAAENEVLYLHVSPAGDCWTAPSLFAAKHLTPDYVVSLTLPCDAAVAEDLLALLEDDVRLAQQVYDDKALPADWAERLRQHQQADEPD